MNLSSKVAGRALAACMALLALAAGSGCSLNEMIAEGGKVDYKSSAKLPPLDIPPDLVNPRGDERFAIPDRSARDRTTLSGYQTARTAERPAGESRVLPSAQGVRVERNANQRWLVVDKPAAALWPVLKEFWQESGFSVQVEMPEIGVMETDWVENRAKIPQDIIRRTLGKLIDNMYSSGELDKFRTRLESVSGGTEIYISHRGMEEVYTNQRKETTRWQARAIDPELEAEFVTRLMVKLGGNQERAKAMVAAGAPESRAQLVGAGDAQQVEVRESFDRAWRRVGLALDRGGFTVEDRDRSQGVYFVRYIDPDLAVDKPNFFSKLFSSNSKANTQQFRVKVVGTGEVTHVTVQGKDGAALAADTDRKTGARILALLRDQLQQ